MSKLSHYLRSERRRAGLSQKDVAALMGLRSVAQISRYEQFRRWPPLKVALTYEAIFGKPVAQIFEGTYVNVQKAVRVRARRLLHVAQSVASRGRREESLERILGA